MWRETKGRQTMYKIDEIVVYGVYGLCKIVEISTRSVGEEETEYYILRPVKDPKTTLFVPTQNKAMTDKMRVPLNAEEINVLVNETPQESIWIDNQKLRREEYRRMLQNGDRKVLILMVRTLKNRKEEQLSKGKKFHATDEAFLREAEETLAEEFCYVLQASDLQVRRFILDGGEILDGVKR